MLTRNHSILIVDNVPERREQLKAMLFDREDSVVEAETSEAALDLMKEIRADLVITDLVTQPYEGRPEEWERVKRIFNIIADRVESVTPWLARRILDNTQNGARISWSSTWKVMARFATAPFRKRGLFE